MCVVQAQLEAQRRETRAANDSLAEATAEMENILFENKQLVKQWNSRPGPWMPPIISKQPYHINAPALSGDEPCRQAEPLWSQRSALRSNLALRWWARAEAGGGV